ncbi:MAG: phytanoyl-CoA dioxygenase family protein [Actinobacteria bacterium]|uniref:Unannotated protein n=1 Tax=freshwater metagenome TaxID=449393 RepID=A0A6J5Z4S7_9ZZZZ|nr:phytanoyl-CoA dioxygenase family protein [Actinomycetota bacterium]
MIESFSDEQAEAFNEDGFLIIEEGFISDEAVEILRERFDHLFAGDYQTGISPDEVNWVKGRDPETKTRQICNGWKADDLIAAQVLSEHSGRLAAQLAGWEGTRVVHDNCLWKPPGARTLGMHQDGSYAGYVDPPEMITVWVALDQTFAQSGTIEYVNGSHKWPKMPPSRGDFHDPDDWLAPVAAAAPEGVSTERTPVVVKPGGASMHHSLVFHGSGINEATIDRRALVTHMIRSDARFDPVNTDPIYTRYRRRGDTTMDESYFPILWDKNGNRSAWLSELPGLPGGGQA